MPPEKATPRDRARACAHIMEACPGHPVKRWRTRLVALQYDQGGVRLGEGGEFLLADSATKVPGTPARPGWNPGVR